MEKRVTPGRVSVAVLAVVLVVGGCAETQLGAQMIKSATRPSGPPVAATPVKVDRTLAPEAFEATGLTIWDGAATLQGIWFAHPLAQKAQRVRVSNPDNGLVTEGALFRRDPALSGPSILVSSDAARSLGLTPGAATELQIVALREGPLTRVADVQNPETDEATVSNVETQALAAPEDAAPETEAAADNIATSDAGTEAEDIAPASAVAETQEVAEPVDVAAVSPPSPEPVAAAANEDAATPSAPVVAAANEVAATPPPPVAAAASEVAATPPPPAQTQPVPLDDRAAQAILAEIENDRSDLPQLIEVENSNIALADTRVAEAGTTADENEPIAPVAIPAPPIVEASATRPTPAPRPETRVAARTADNREDTAELKPVAAVPALDDIGPANSALPSGDYLQIGSFSIEPNASILVQRLLRRGQPGQYVNRTVNGSMFSIVVIGPLANSDEVEAARRAAASEGLKDTIKVTL